MGGIKINKAYAPLITSNKRYFLLTGGRASLKSTTIHDFASRLTYEKRHGILITRYTMSSAEKSIIPEFESSIKLNGSFADFHKSGNKYTNKHTGSFILFSGIKTSSGDQTASLKSLAGITTWIIDEGEDFQDEATFDDIDDSIRGNWNQNRVIWVQNPSTKEHFIYDRWIVGNSKTIVIEDEQILVSNHEDVEAIHTTFHIAEKMGYLSNSFLNKIKRVKNSNYKKYVHKYLGGWLDKAEGVIFEIWREGEFDESLPYIYGMDFGYVTDPTTAVKVAVCNTTMKLYVKGHLYKTGLSTDEIAKELSTFTSKNDLIIGDNAEPRLISELWDKGYNINPCQKGKDSIKNGIAKMQDYEIVVHPDSHDIKKELNNYAWHDKKSNTPQDKYNHYIDAIRYAFTDLVDDNEFFVS
jgi:phage terminase large subunit